MTTSIAAPVQMSLSDSMTAAALAANLADQTGEFFPAEPPTLEATGLLATDVEPLILKLLLNNGSTFGRKVAEQIRLPFGIVAEQLRILKAQYIIRLSNDGAVGDFEYELTEEGERKAHWHAERCTFCGAAPVPMDAYIASVERQSIRKLKPQSGLLHTHALYVIGAPSRP